MAGVTAVRRGRTAPGDPLTDERFPLVALTVR